MESFYRALPGSAREYFRKRSELAFSGSAFNACEKYSCSSCCTDQHIYITLTGFDLLAMGLVGNKLPSQIFDESAIIRIDPFISPGKVKPVLSIDMPCHYLNGGACSMHKDGISKKYIGKPLDCAVFPENIYATGKFGITEEVREKNSRVFSIEDGGYPCLLNRKELDEDRMNKVFELGRISMLERHVSDMYFGLVPVDTTQFVPENLSEEDTNTYLIAITNLMCRGRCRKGSDAYNDVQKHVRALDTADGIKELFGMLNTIEDQPEALNYLPPRPMHG